MKARQPCVARRAHVANIEAERKGTMRYDKWKKKTSGEAIERKDLVLQTDNSEDQVHQ